MNRTLLPLLAFTVLRNLYVVGLANVVFFFGGSGTVAGLFDLESDFTSVWSTTKLGCLPARRKAESLRSPAD